MLQKHLCHCAYLLIFFFFKVRNTLQSKILELEPYPELLKVGDDIKHAYIFC